MLVNFLRVYVALHSLKINKNNINYFHFDFDIIFNP